ncbi:MAG: bifunctional riboflavin kinase/FAD synthetase [Acidimicrobiales bacterium]
MEIIRDPSPGDRPPGGAVVTIGAYDGVHLGHQWVISEVIRRARQARLGTTVVTFDRHPATVVRPESAPLLLCDLDQKLELLAATGVDRTAVVTFDEDRANETAEDFVAQVLVGALGARVVVVGEDFHFGHGRKGNVSFLVDMGRDLGFEVEGISLRVEPDRDEVVSSTRIRALVACGDVAGAARLLGRRFQLRGPVAHGDARGATELGFPTANLDLAPELALPGVGIYAGIHTRPDGVAHAAAISVGYRPTFYDTDHAPGDVVPPPLVESHLLDFDGDLYGEEAKVDFVARLHDEKRFESVDDLIAQMRIDVDDTRRLMAGEVGAG